MFINGHYVSWATVKNTQQRIQSPFGIAFEKESSSRWKSPRIRIA